MTNQEFQAAAMELIKQTVNAIADHEYEKMASFV